MTDQSFLKLLASSIRDNWNRPAFSNYKGNAFSYAQFGERIVQVRLLLEAANIKPGDKVSIIGRNSAGWAMDFFGIISYGCVAVPILHDFKPASVHHIIKHSDSKLLFVANSVWENLDISKIQHLEAVLLINDMKVLYSQNPDLQEENFCENLLKEKYPNGVKFEDIQFYKEDPEELVMLSYTSGTSGFSKGVMIPWRALWSNTRFGLDSSVPFAPGTNTIAMLPMSHMYGLSFEVCTEICCGVHIHFLTRTPSPRVISETFKKYRPVLIVVVPLIMEKFVRKEIFPLLENKRYKILRHIPGIREHINETICQKLKEAFGENFYEIIVGGAAFSPDVDSFLHQIHFPYTVGYGMTECAPLIAYSDWKEYKEYSVGKAIPRMEIRIDSDDPENVVGEIQVRGTSVMKGYYHNEEATQQAFTEDGWMRTGDLGTIDSEGYLYIRGRCKNMLLGLNGQNIYPEEIEFQLNVYPYVGESIIVSRDEKLIALIHPDLEAADRDGVSLQSMNKIMQDNLDVLNKELPIYCRLSGFQIYLEEFEKTPKHSIKRYLYQ